MSTSTAAIPWRRRTDLQSRLTSTGCLLKDPVAQRHFQLGREAYFVWLQLSGQVTAEAVCAEFSRQFAPRRLTREQLRQFLQQLIREGLVWGEAPGVAEMIEQRRATAGTLQNWSRWTSILSYRLRGIDPDRWLSPLTRRWGWLFEPLALTVGALWLLSGLVLWLRNWDEFAHRFPEEMAQWQVGDVLTFAVVLAVLKGIHECGHGIACQKFGGEVRELGVMFLIFTPCFYCNVSDAWMMPSRWQRFWVSAAGMWLELLLAAGCLWLWWASEPGWFHAICLQVVLLVVVSTLAFNLNPLLRYDGYFLLSDLCGIPNLQQRASQELQRRLRQATGFVSDAPPRDFQASTCRWLAVYALASLLYRVWMVATIVWLLDRWLEPQGLQVVAQFLSATALLGLLAGPAMALVNACRSPQARQRWLLQSPWRMLLALLLTATVVLWPWPSRVIAPIVLMPASARGVFVTQEGELTMLVAAGTQVQQDDILAVLSNPDLERDRTKLEGEVRQAELWVESLQRRQILNDRVQWQLPAARQRLADVQEQLEQLRQRQQSLTLRAPRSGVFWPAPEQSSPSRSGRLSHWTGSLFEAQNQNAWLTTGTQLGWIGEGQTLEALAIVPQTTAARLRPEQSVVVVAESAISSRWLGSVDTVANARLEELPAELAQRLQVPELSSPEGSRLVGSWYQVRIPLQQAPTSAIVLGRGTASIQAPPEPLYVHAWRWLRETFHILR